MTQINQTVILSKAKDDEDPGLATTVQSFWHQKPTNDRNLNRMNISPVTPIE
jgi:hypothetical protein